MTPEEMVVNMAEATARLNAPGYGDPVAKVRELVEHAGRNQPAECQRETCGPGRRRRRKPCWLCGRS